MADLMIVSLTTTARVRATAARAIRCALSTLTDSMHLLALAGDLSAAEAIGSLGGGLADVAAGLDLANLPPCSGSGGLEACPPTCRDLHACPLGLEG